MAHRRYNQLTVEIAAAYSTTRIVDSWIELPKAQNIEFETFGPVGGPYLRCSFFVPRRVTRTWNFKGNQTVRIRNRRKLVFEGVISQVGYLVGNGAKQGRTITCVGVWGPLFEKRYLNKPWADNRVSEDVWVFQTGATGADEAYLDRNNRLRFSGKSGTGWTNGDYVAVRYTAPTGQTIKRITYDYSLDETGQSWELQLYNVGTAGNEAGTGVTTTTTGSIDRTLGTPSQAVELRWIATADQTPDTKVQHGEFSNIVVYTELGAINAQEIAIDIRALLSAELNGDITRIGALTLGLAPFITTGQESYASILERALAYGDAGNNSWCVRLGHSELEWIASPDGREVLILEQAAGLTGYDYAVRMDDKNLLPEVELAKDTNSIFNYIKVRYFDELNNREVWLTPADDASLLNQASINEWGRREDIVDAGLATAALALKAGQRRLAAHKDPRFYVKSGPVSVKGYIRNNRNQRVPASEIIAANTRLRFETFLVDEVAVAGAGLTFPVTHTSYDDRTQICQISCGVPDDLAVLLAAGLARANGSASLSDRPGRGV